MQCIDCDIQYSGIGYGINNMVKYCTTCANILTPIPRGSIRPERELNMFDNDMREMIENFLSRSDPARQISKQFLKGLGKVKVDSKRTILANVTLTVGSLKFLSVPTTFLPLPVDTSFDGMCVMSNPEYAESSLQVECVGKILVVRRGKVSFVAKWKEACRCGAIAVIVLQSEGGMWPFCMSDSANEIGSAAPSSSSSSRAVPMVMVGYDDALVLESLCFKVGKDAAATTGTTIASSVAGVCMSFGCSVLEEGVECSICQEDIKEDEDVYKLPCSHCYHVDCVSLWLEDHRTCPLCRFALPLTTEEEKKTESHGGRNAVEEMYFN